MNKVNYSICTLKALFSIVTIMLFSFQIHAQVTGVKYFLDQIEVGETSAKYSMNIVITEGASTSSFISRILGNSAISILTPANSKFEIVESFMPLFNNTNQNGVIPVAWLHSGDLVHINSIPEYDFHGLVPEIAPSVYFNDLSVGMKVHLFDFVVSNAACTPFVRLFENGVDPDQHHPETMGRNFNNGFTIGGPNQDYKGNLPTQHSLIESVYIDGSSKLHTKAIGSSFSWYDCNSQKLLATTSEPYYEPSPNGSYKVEVDANSDCPIYSDCFQ